LVLGALWLLPGSALAHVGVGEVSGFATGFSHPLLGLDHLLAMVAVGLWAAQAGGRRVWIVPAAFVCVMALGAALGMLGVQVPFVEQGILASVMVLGLLIAGAARFPVAASVAVVALFALFHGHAHGTEIPPAASGVAYFAGFTVATAMLHVIGIGFGMALKQAASGRLARYAGGAIAALGVCLAFGFTL